MGEHTRKLGLQLFFYMLQPDVLRKACVVF
jgi:hypothetical protein